MKLNRKEKDNIMKQVMITDSSTNWIPTLRNVFSEDVQAFESKKGKRLEKQSRKNQVKFLTSLMHGKFYQRRPNNPQGLLPSQYGHVRRSIYKLNPETLAHIIREQAKRI